VPAARAWWLAIRPKTLTAAIAPVAVATALAVDHGVFRPLPALAALAGALLIQIGTNLANDVLDFRRGADTGERLGPTRVVQAGLLPPRRVALGAALAFGLAALAGLYLARVAGPPILVVGIASIAAGVLYTAGPFPLAYVGLGDAFVIVFFGLVAVGGTYYVQSPGPLPPAAAALGLAVGSLSAAILAVNNLRDVETDRAAGKRTLAVRLGPAVMRRYYVGLVLAAFLLPAVGAAAGALPAASLLVLGAAPAALAPTRAVLAGAAGRALNGVLGQTARLQMLHAALLSLGLVL
jgi:1,4-dihydroxy-2-naphthoate octaprenyltransferase